MSPGIRAAWALVALVVGVQIGYPVTAGAARTAVTVGTVLAGAAATTVHAAVTRGPLWTLRLLLVVAGGSFAVEAVGVATGWPFGGYAYTDGLGPRLLGVPLLVPLAWTMLAYPAWLAAGALVPRAFRVPVAAWALASWDLFLDPQMVDAGRWVWADPTPALPGVPGVPAGNYAGWLAVSLVLMALLCWVDTTPAVSWPADAPPLVLYLWTYAGSVLAHAVFLDLPGSAVTGGLAMGLVAVPLAVFVLRRALA